MRVNENGAEKQFVWSYSGSNFAVKWRSNSGA